MILVESVAARALMERKNVMPNKSVLVMLEKAGWALSAKTLHFIPTGGSAHHTCASNIMDDMG